VSALVERRVHLALLYDFYGPLLTDRQRRFIELHYHQDWSLGEIAAAFGISRQAVHDLVRRAVAALEEYEARLGLVRRYRRQREAVDSLARCLDQSQQLLAAWQERGDPEDLRRLRLSLRRGRRLAQRLLREV